MTLVEQLRAHLAALAQPRNPIKYPEAHRYTQQYLSEQIRGMSRKLLRQEFPVNLDGIPAVGMNLLGEATEGSVVMVAHYDTVDDSPGADDNLSAVAVALEVGRRCPNVHLLFTDLEEAGLLGARHFVSTGKWRELPAVVLESVGYWSKEAGSQGYPSSLPVVFPAHFQWLKEREFRGDFLALLHLSSASSIARSLSEHLGPDQLPIEVPDLLIQREEAQELRDFGRSDHLAFWEDGRVCLMLTDSANFRNPHYHSPGDTPDTLDLTALVKLTKSLVEWCSALTPLSISE
ncbi:MAG: M28 family peptidase [Vulcanimicrobiota bacterium]